MQTRSICKSKGRTCKTKICVIYVFYTSSLTASFSVAAVRSSAAFKSEAVFESVDSVTASVVVASFSSSPAGSSPSSVVLLVTASSNAF